MALTRSMLKSMGLDEDKVDSIIEAHSETVDGLKKEVEQYKSKADSYDKVKSELEQLKETAKNSGDYDKLKKEFDDYKADVQQKETIAAKKAALTKVAKDAGLSEAGISKAIKYADWSAFELDDKGDVKDGKALVKSLKEEWPEYIQTTRATGVQIANPPAKDSEVLKTRDEIYKTDEHGRFLMDASQRQAALAQLNNH